MRVDKAKEVAVGTTVLTVFGVEDGAFVEVLAMEMDDVFVGVSDALGIAVEVLVGVEVCVGVEVNVEV